MVKSKKKFFDDEEKPKEVKKPSGKTLIKPLKDWHIVFNEYDIYLKEGEEIEIPDMFLAPLKTDKVIK